ncbi:protein of unknown function [Pseudodesulfovibrio piezophilus C1TLV30]|uniref:Uncharacterized protein n=1 Tax=Pseudodesulfovibrio piezophilus (strain DSM 21447 / JCM 15486 / C1TLV30) TaxID=1322246 RepID=M1WNI3_PSEP2|nr:protein of unknown function [Pseudodesulfovibrio piezophilus C1TLV30]
MFRLQDVKPHGVIVKVEATLLNFAFLSDKKVHYLDLNCAQVYDLIIRNSEIFTIGGSI